MISPLSTALSGIAASVTRATQAATAVVNASSTPKNGDENLDTGLIGLQRSALDLSTNIFAAKQDQKMTAALLDIKV